MHQGRGSKSFRLSELLSRLSSWWRGERSWCCMSPPPETSTEYTNRITFQREVSPSPAAINSFFAPAQYITSTICPHPPASSLSPLCSLNLNKQSHPKNPGEYDVLDDDQYQAVRGASNPLFLSCHQSSSLDLSIGQCPTLPVPHFFSLLLARSKVLPASTKITLLSLSCSSHLHIQDNHNNQRSISQLRHFGVNLITAWRSLQEQDSIFGISAAKEAQLV